MNLLNPCPICEKEVKVYIERYDAFQYECIIVCSDWIDNDDSCLCNWEIKGYAETKEEAKEKAYRIYEKIIGFRNDE